MYYSQTITPLINVQKKRNEIQITALRSHTLLWQQHQFKLLLWVMTVKVFLFFFPLTTCIPATVSYNYYFDERLNLSDMVIHSLLSLLFSISSSLLYCSNYIYYFYSVMCSYVIEKKNLCCWLKPYRPL